MNGLTEETLALRSHPDEKPPSTPSWTRWVVGILLVVAIWFGSIATLITLGPIEDPAETADVGIVLGAAVDGDAPSPVFAARIDHGIELYRSGRVQALIFTGARSPEDSLSEAAAARDYAVAAGIPAADITIEEKSRTTLQNLSEAEELMRANGQISALVVSDPLHLWRANMMAEDLDMIARMSAASGTLYRSWSTKAPFLAREVYFVHHYWLFGE